MFFKSNKEKFLNSLENNDFKKAEKLVFHKDIDIFNNFALYLSEAENSDNEDFITTYLNLFLNPSTLEIPDNCLNDLHDYIYAWQKEKNYIIIEKILNNNYIIIEKKSGSIYSLNKCIIYDFSYANDINGFELSLKYIQKKELINDIVDFLLKNNHIFLTYLFDKHEHLIHNSLKEKPELKENNIFQRYSNQHKISKF